MSKNLFKAPLPFQGQKKNFIKQFREVITSLNDEYIYIDLFGGSGLLSANIKDIHPQARVLYNDYDNYTGRCQRVQETNKILHELRKISGGGGGTSRNSPLDEKSTKQVKELVKKYPCCDYITLASSLFFSSKLPSSRENFFMEKYYNKIRITDYDEETVKRFHQGLEIVREDYRTIVEGFAGKSRVVYIMDPPYLSTDVSTYSSSQYWKLKDHLDIVSIMHSSNAIYFTSDKSNLIELNQWLVDNKYRSFFSPTAKICTVTNNLAKHISYKDYMIVDIDTIKQ